MPAHTRTAGCRLLKNVRATAGAAFLLKCFSSGQRFIAGGGGFETSKTKVLAARAAAVLKRVCGEREVQVSVARYLRTPPYAARHKDLSFGDSNCLRSQSHCRSTIVVCNCTVWAGTVAPRRDKANPFRRPSILFRPHDPQTKDVGGAAGYRPRVRSVYYERVYVHSPEGHLLYRARSGRDKEGKQQSSRVSRR